MLSNMSDNNFVKCLSIYAHTIPSPVKHIQQMALSKLKGPLQSDGFNFKKLEIIQL